MIINQSWGSGEKVVTMEGYEDFADTSVPEYGNKRKRKGGGADGEKVECSVFIGRFW